MNILGHGGHRALHLDTGGIAVPWRKGPRTPASWRRQKFATAVRQVVAHLSLTAASTDEAGASRPSREKSSCWFSASESGSPVDAAGPLPLAKPRRDNGSVGLRESGRWLNACQYSVQGTPISFRRSSRLALSSASPAMSTVFWNSLTRNQSQRGCASSPRPKMVLALIELETRGHVWGCRTDIDGGRAMGGHGRHLSLMAGLLTFSQLLRLGALLLSFGA